MLTVKQKWRISKFLELIFNIHTYANYLKHLVKKTLPLSSYRAATQKIVWDNVDFWIRQRKKMTI